MVATESELNFLASEVGRGRWQDSLLHDWLQRPNFAGGLEDTQDKGQ